jgi:hypothetical protein
MRQSARSRCPWNFNELHRYACISGHFLKRSSSPASELGSICPSNSKFFLSVMTESICRTRSSSGARFLDNKPYCLRSRAHCDVAKPWSRYAPERMFSSMSSSDILSSNISKDRYVKQAIRRLRLACILSIKLISWLKRYLQLVSTNVSLLNLKHRDLLLNSEMNEL